MSEANPIININDAFVEKCVFDRLFIDKQNLEHAIKELCADFLRKHPHFQFENIMVFDVYCDKRCIVNLKLQ